MLKLIFYVIVFVWKANRGPNNSVKDSYVSLLRDYNSVIGSCREEKTLFFKNFMVARILIMTGYLILKIENTSSVEMQISLYTKRLES